MRAFVFHGFINLCLQPHTPLEVEIAIFLKNSKAATVTPKGKKCST